MDVDSQFSAYLFGYDLVPSFQRPWNLSPFLRAYCHTLYRHVHPIKTFWTWWTALYSGYHTVVFISVVHKSCLVLTVFFLVTAAYDKILFHFFFLHYISKALRSSSSFCFLWTYVLKETPFTSYFYPQIIDIHNLFDRVVV